MNVIKVNVTDEGVVIPKQWLNGVTEVEIRRDNGAIVVIPIGPIGTLDSSDPLLQLGQDPIPADIDSLSDASTNLDHYLYRS